MARRTLKLLLIAVFSLALLAWCAPAQAQITYVGAGTIGGALTTTDATAALPAGTQADDILLVACSVRSITDTTVVSGYTVIEADKDTSTGSHSWFWKRHDGTEGTATCNKSASADSFARQYAFRGVRTTSDPWNALVAAQVDNGTTDPTTFTGITTGAANSMVVIMDGYEDNDGSVAVVTSTDPAAYTEDYAESATGTDGSLEISYAIRTAAGATGNISINYGTIAARSDSMAVLVLSLDPVVCTGICNVQAPTGVTCSASPCLATVAATGSGNTLTVVATHDANATVSSCCNAGCSAAWAAGTVQNTANGTVMTYYCLSSSAGATSIGPTWSVNCNTPNATSCTTTVREFSSPSGMQLDSGATPTAGGSGATQNPVAPSLTVSATNKLVIIGAHFGGSLSACNQAYVCTFPVANGEGYKNNITSYTAPTWTGDASNNYQVVATALEEITGGGGSGGALMLPLIGVGAAFLGFGLAIFYHYMQPGGSFVELSVVCPMYCSRGLVRIIRLAQTRNIRQDLHKEVLTKAPTKLRHR